MEFFLIIAILSCIPHNLISLRYEVKTITSGLAFIKMNEASITYTTWQLSYYYDLTDYFDQVNKIKAAIESIRALCKLTLNKKECELVLSLLDNHMENSKLSSERVESFSNNRKKRWAPLGYVGDVNSWLFGYMTQDDAEEMTGNIKKLQERVIKQQDLFKDQILIIKQSLNIGNKKYNELKNNIVLLNNNLNELERNFTISEKINSLTHIVTLTIMHHAQISETLMNLLQNSLNGKIITLISQQQLKNNLQTIAENLSNNQRLPINLKNQHPFNIFSITTSRATLYKKKILITLDIPIVDREELSLYKTIPIPTEVGEKLIIIIPTMKYFLLNTNKREITPITHDEIEQCKKTPKNELLCTPESATIINKENSCELSLIMNPKPEIIENLCEFRLVPKRNYIVQIHQSNKYYCIINNPIIVTENCPEQNIITTSISTNGIINLKPGCSITTNEIKITAFNTIKTKSQILTPLFHLNKLTKDGILEISGNLSYLMKRNYSILVLENHNEELIALSEQINRNMEKSREKIDLDDLMYTSQRKTYITIALTCAAIIALFILYRKCIK